MHAGAAVLFYSRRIRDLLTGIVFFMLIGVSVVSVAVFMQDLEDRRTASKLASTAGIPHGKHTDTAEF